MEGRKEMFYLTTHSTHFIYGYMTSDIWLRTILIVRKETRCRHIGYSFRLTARVLLYAPSHRQDSTYHGLCYTSRSALHLMVATLCLQMSARRSYRLFAGQEEMLPGSSKSGRYCSMELLGLPGVSARCVVRSQHWWQGRKEGRKCFI